MAQSQIEITNIYMQPILQLITQARSVHTKNFDDEIELCHLISIKTGGCPEDCKYCSQSIHNNSKIKLNPLLSLTEVEDSIKEAKLNGVKRVCLGAAYRSPTKSALKTIVKYIKLIKQYNLEACATLGAINQEQAIELKNAGLDYYNHNIDTSPEYYKQIASTHSFNDRLTTINTISKVGIKVCCGGILGLGEDRQDRISFIHALTKLPTTPSSIPINTLVKIDGTQLTNNPELNQVELLRVIATLRIIFPTTIIRLAAGRNKLTELEQILLFMAGANSIFFGDKLLTTLNNQQHTDITLLNNLK